MEVLNPYLILKDTQKTMLDSKAQTMYLFGLGSLDFTFKSTCPECLGFVEPGIQF